MSKYEGRLGFLALSIVVTMQTSIFTNKNMCKSVTKIILQTIQLKDIQETLIMMLLIRNSLHVLTTLYRRPPDKSLNCTSHSNVIYSNVRNK